MSKQWLRAIIPEAYNFYAHVVGWLGKKTKNKKSTLAMASYYTQCLQCHDVNEMDLCFHQNVILTKGKTFPYFKRVTVT